MNSILKPIGELENKILPNLREKVISIPHTAKLGILILWGLILLGLIVFIIIPMQRNMFQIQQDIDFQSQLLSMRVDSKRGIGELNDVISDMREDIDSLTESFAIKGDIPQILGWVQSSANAAGGRLNTINYLTTDEEDGFYDIRLDITFTGTYNSFDILMDNINRMPLSNSIYKMRVVQEEDESGLFPNNEKLNLQMTLLIPATTLKKSTAQWELKELMAMSEYSTRPIFYPGEEGMKMKEYVTLYRTIDPGSFILTGILRVGNRYMATIEYNNESHLVEKDDYIENVRVHTVNPSRVLLSMKGIEFEISLD